ncbi:MAG TPA: YbjN domain-containing protein [Candidatus Limnocylindrales bacterium]|nr:YbjN domain-containing protein [Candidatus Limnocylindrales bacterium]
MPPRTPPTARPTASADDLERWFTALGLEPGARAEREGTAAWDVTLDGAIRRDLRVTVILDPSLGAIVWAHLAPPILDAFRKTYRTLLQWNDTFPFVKFSLADDGRPILEVELPSRWLDEEELGLALARVIAVADRVFEGCREWLWIGGRVPAGYAERPRRTERLRERFAVRLGELVSPEPAP